MVKSRLKNWILDCGKSAPRNEWIVETEGEPDDVNVDLNMDVCSLLCPSRLVMFIDNYLFTENFYDVAFLFCYWEKVKVQVTVYVKQFYSDKTTLFWNRLSRPAVILGSTTEDSLDTTCIADLPSSLSVSGFFVRMAIPLRNPYCSMQLMSANEAEMR